jgi:hypothetical protein
LAKRALLLAAILGPIAVLALWVAVHRYEWLGPLVANTLRAVVGSKNVTRLEDFAYGVEDRVNLVWRRSERPKAYWSVPSDPEPASVEPVAARDDTPALPTFLPKDPGPMHPEWAAPGDGQWVAIADPRRPDEPPYMYKTLLHPDPTRSWAELFVVAVDLKRSRVHLVAGTREPSADNEPAKAYPRPGVIPAEHHEELLAAFNGGFMTEHGGWGMVVDGVTLVKPRDNGCTLAVYEDDTVRIATWRRLKDTARKMRWFRQGPECMFEDGKMHVGLTIANARKWGATLDGDTVIRRSALGISEDGQILYVGISNHTAARPMAEGMRHVGSPVVVQMDVNWSYPKFVLYEPGDAGPERLAVALAPGFEFSRDEYIRQKSRRDFFYLMRRDTESVRASN